MTEDEKVAKAKRDARAAAGFKLARSLTRDALLFGGALLVAHGISRIYSPLAWIFLGACAVGLAFFGTGGDKQ